MGDMLQKETSAVYTRAYQENQIQKYRNRGNNHWKYRIELADRLVNDHVLPRKAGLYLSGSVVVDVGCSIGTFAIEFAKKGFRAFGVDFDQVALEMARELAEEEGVEVTFVCSDVADWPEVFPKIDIAVCFDLFEHLHDDELGALLIGIRRQLSDNGVLIFHTYPTEYEYIFFGRTLVTLPLVPFAWLPPEAFTRLTKCYGALLDGIRVLFRGKTHRDSIARDVHCNLLTKERIQSILERAQYDVIYLDTDNLFPDRPNRPRMRAWFKKQSITHNNLFGVALREIKSR